MSCGAGRSPGVACGEPSDGAVYVQACPAGHVAEVELCAFHRLLVTQTLSRHRNCTACWVADGSLVPVTITTKDTT